MPNPPLDLERIAKDAEAELDSEKAKLFSNTGFERLNQRIADYISVDYGVRPSSEAPSIRLDLCRLCGSSSRASSYWKDNSF